MSPTFSTNCGSAESLKISVRCGCRENARQMQCTDDADTPDALAMPRVLRCVAPAGFVSSVLTTGASTWSSPILRGAPHLGLVVGAVETTPGEPFPPRPHGLACQPM